VAVLLLLVAGIALVAIYLSELRVAEFDFEDRNAVAASIERGWLPSWFPVDIAGAQGAHRTFDENFIWITGVLPKGDDFIRTHCASRLPDQVALPSADYLRRFPERVRATRDRLRGDQLVYFVCSDAQQEFFAAIDESTSTFALWAY
jgi:hypothetical protein